MKKLMKRSLIARLLATVAVTGNCAISSECHKHRHFCSVDSNRFPPLLELWREEKAINHQTVLLL